MPKKFARSIEYDLVTRVKIKLWRQRQIPWFRIAKLLDISFATLIKHVDSDPNFPKELRSFRMTKAYREKVKERKDQAAN
jgi:hypothetical protein